MIRKLFTTLCLSVITVLSAWAQPSGGNGLVDEPWQIATAADLVWFRQYVNNNNDLTRKNAILTADIDLSSVCNATAGNWTPIGADSYGLAFSGTFDGQGHTIRGLYIHATSSNMALFRYAKNAIIKDLTLEDVDIDLGSSASYVAGLVAKAENCTITGICVEGSLRGSAYVAGIASGITNCTIEDCRNEASISTASYAAAAGIAAYVREPNFINRCVNVGSIYSYDSTAGGIVPESASTGVLTITNCLNTAPVKARRGYAGGIIGAANSATAIIRNCLSTGPVESVYNNGIGLLVGNTWNGNPSTPPVLTIENCYASTEATLTYDGNPYTNGHDLYGVPADGTVLTLSDIGTLTPEQLASGIAALRLQGNQASTQWGQDLAASQAIPTPGVSNQVYLDGTINCKNEFTGTPTNTPVGTPVIEGHDWPNGICHVCDEIQQPALDNGYYLLGNAGHLMWFRDFVNNTGGNNKAKAKLIADIDLSDVCSEASGNSWTPVCPNNSYFYRGTFDGQHHSITGLYINSTSKFRGLFGYHSGVIKDLTLTCDVTSTNDYVGGLVGYIDSGGEVSGVTVNGSVHGNENVGGIAGYVSSSSACVEDAVNNANVEADHGYVGGIVGYNLYGKLYRVVNNGTINSTSTSTYYAGGIVGQNAGQIFDAYNAGDVHCAYEKSYGKTGGIAGGSTASDGILAYCLNVGNVYTQMSTNASLDGVGLIVGGNDSGMRVYNCYSITTANLYNKGEVYNRENRLATSSLTTTTAFTAREATPEQMASGEVAYYLQDDRDERTFWGQRIGTDDLPSIQPNYQVYLSGAINCDGTIAYGGFTNTPTDPTIIPHSFADNGVCTNCNHGEEPEEVNGVRQISKAGHLVWLRDAIDKGNNALNAAQTADIDLSSVCSERLGSWIPNTVNKYVGTYDGQNHKITGLYCKGNKMSQSGLFGEVDRNGVLRNMDVTGEITYAKGNAGMLCSYLIGTVENCTARGVLHSTYDKVGGISGSANGGIVTDCVSYVNITLNSGTCRHAGGVVGDLMNNCNITRCTNYGTIDGSGFPSLQVGGIAGYNENSASTIVDCVNYGAVNIGIGRETGGILGASNQGTKITSCANYGQVLSKSMSGGILGSPSGAVTVTACANYGPIQSEGDYAGGILGGIASGIKVYRCFNHGSVTSTSGKTTCAPIVYVVNVSSYTVSGCYYSALAWTGADNVEGKACSNADLASGRVAYLLGEPFGQELGVDTYPVLGHRPVYYGRYEQCGDTPVGATDQYSNSVLFADGPHHHFGYDRLCALCHAHAPIYDFLVDGDNWTSDNQGKGSSDSKKDVDWAALKSGSKVAFDWTVDSEAGYDKLTVTLYVYSGGSYARVSDIVDHISGLDRSGHAEYTITADGDYRLTMLYHKDSSGDGGTDTATVTNLRLVLAKPYADGNINCDTEVNLTDVSALQQILLGSSAPTVMSDVNNDGRVTIADLTTLIQELTK